MARKGPVLERVVTKDEVQEWLQKASRDELNIFHDRNEIIVLLCKALLAAWKELGWLKSKKEDPRKR